jgi:hypothetical protein
MHSKSGGDNWEVEISKDLFPLSTPPYNYALIRKALPPRSGTR